MADTAIDYEKTWMCPKVWNVRRVCSPLPLRKRRQLSIVLVYVRKACLVSLKLETFHYQEGLERNPSNLRSSVTRHDYYNLSTGHTKSCHLAFFQNVTTSLSWVWVGLGRQNCDETLTLIMSIYFWCVRDRAADFKSARVNKSTSVIFLATTRRCSNSHQNAFPREVHFSAKVVPWNNNDDDDPVAISRERPPETENHISSQPKRQRDKAESAMKTKIWRQVRPRETEREKDQYKPSHHVTDLDEKDLLLDKIYIMPIYVCWAQCPYLPFHVSRWRFVYTRQSHFEGWEKGEFDVLGFGFISTIHQSYLNFASWIRLKCIGPWINPLVWQERKLLRSFWEQGTRLLLLLLLLLLGPVSPPQSFIPRGPL